METDSHAAASLRGSAAFELTGCDLEAAELLVTPWNRRRPDRPLLDDAARLSSDVAGNTGQSGESAQMLLQVLTLKGNSLFPLGAFFPAPGSFI